MHHNEEYPYLQGLNPQQKEAVLHTTGPLLILAGAGSGKTRVITHRIVHLIHEGVAPHHILAVTFTNKAAAEMRERLEALLTSQGTLNRAYETRPLLTTFHALGVRILREFHAYLHLPKYFTIYDRQDSLRAVKQALTALDYNPKEFEPRRILGKISRAKGDNISPEALLERATSFPDQVASHVFTRYETILKEEHALDFDDLLTKTLHLLSHHTEVVTLLKERFTHIHIDEYQDTNAVQFAIARALTAPPYNICVVGDIDQNIYSWRGADIKNVLQFERHFPETTTILLEENYRSTKTIIAASNDIIKQNKQRVEKNVFTKNHDGELIRLFPAVTEYDEADYITRTCRTLIEQGIPPGDIAILFRTNFQSRVLEEAFLSTAIPYQLLGTKFYERKEIKDVLSYLRLALNNDSMADLVRIINEPTRGIGKVTMLKVVEGKRHELTGAALLKVQQFDELISKIRTAAETKPVHETLKYIMQQTGIEAALIKEGTEEELSRLENLRELVSLAKRYAADDPLLGVQELLETAALQSDQDELPNGSKDAVRLMTVHAAKGLEFPVVFICGLEEGLFPHERLDDGGVDHEEERRLFYVAITRAKELLYLSYAHLRTIYGTQRVNIPSSFLNDIDRSLITLEEPKGFGGGPSGYETTIFLD